MKDSSSLSELRAQSPDYVRRERKILRNTLVALAGSLALTTGALALDRNEQYGKYIIGGMIISMACIPFTAYNRLRHLDKEYTALEQERRG